MITKVSISDQATPALERLNASFRSRVTPAVGAAVATLFQGHFDQLPSNKLNWPSTGFWKRAAQNTSFEITGQNVAIKVDQEGVGQRRFGGWIQARRSKWLTIPARAEAYGKSARDFGNLRFVPFARPYEAALVEKTPASGLRISDVVVYWLKKAVYQSPDSKVTPSAAEIHTVAMQAVERVVDQAKRRGGNL